MKTYKNGLLFTDGLKKNIEGAYRKIHIEGFHSLITISGTMGKGKTTLAVLIADYYNKICGLGNIDLNKQLAFGSEDFVKKLEICHKENLKVLIYDEAGDFDKRQSMTKQNQNLNMVFNTFRQYKIFIIMCTPSIEVYDERLFKNAVVRWGIHIKKRTPIYASYSLYHVKPLSYTRYYMRTVGAKFPAGVYNFIQTFCHGHFLNLEPKRAEELARISMIGKEKLLSEMMEKDKKLTYMDLPDEYNDKVTINDFIKLSGLTKPTIKTMMVKYDIKPTGSFKGKHLYKQEDLEIFKDYIKKSKDI